MDAIPTPAAHRAAALARPRRLLGWAVFAAGTALAAADAWRWLGGAA